ncbi:MAG: hypothetical protein ACYDGR_11530 [Candidatus Dormibacteria bacterium]
MPGNPSWEAYACPGCGAVLRDTALRECPYCRAALFEENQASSKRVWHTADGGATWTVRERTCAGCGAVVTDPQASACLMCGAPVPPLVVPYDPRPTGAIHVQLPPTPAGPGKITVRVIALVRYLENDWWPVPPSVPVQVAGILRLLPDACPGCRGTTFKVSLTSAEAWHVLCSGCKTSPGTRSTAPPQGDPTR